jgi:uncharacterized cupredoxin-like copper-binding protein
VPGCAVLATAALALPGCGGSGHAGRPAPETLRIGERDFHITAPRTARAGEVTVSVHNHGPETHELIIVRARGAHLPLRGDAMTVDEDAVERATAGTVDDIDPRTTATATVHLRPGRYVMFCNMFGHYRGGMHTDLEVTAG